MIDSANQFIPEYELEVCDKILVLNITNFQCRLH